jgi:hypothetical protein
MTTYGIDTGDGNQITAGLPEHTARETAQRIADERAETVYLYEIPRDEDDDTEAEEIKPRTVHCECGKIIGERCAWSGPKAETTLVEWMPEQHRSGHEAAGNSGSYPHNGAERLRIESETCLPLLRESEGDWLVAR